MILDPDPAGAPSAWRAMRLAWLRTPGGATHRLVVQDDALPVAGAAKRAAEFAERAPTSPLLLYVGTHHSAAQLVIRSSGLVEVPLGGWLPTVAVVLPVVDAYALVIEAHRRLWDDLADDEILGRYCREQRRIPLAAAPCLFDHDDDEPSIVNPTKHYRRRAARL